MGVDSIIKICISCNLLKSHVCSYQQYRSLFFLTFLLESCNVPFYSPAFLKHDITYLAKPITLDSVRSNFFINGVYALIIGQNFGDVQLFGEPNINRSHSFKNMNISCGTMALIGK